MTDRAALVHHSGCAAPEISRLLTAYCFGRATEAERRLVEAHLLECECCWREAHRLEAAVRVLDTDRSLTQMISPAEAAGAFGISGKLDLPFGGHWRHALVACGLYAALYAVALLLEIAYQFDRYGRAGVLLAMVAFGWVFITSLAGLAADWKLTLAGSNKGLAVSVIVFLLAAFALFAGMCLFLPGNPITQMSWQTYTAQAAYLKDICYFLVLETLFLVLPFHFVVAMQHELQAGRHRLALGLFGGDRLSVAPRGAIFPRFWVLALILAVIAGISFFLFHNLMSNLRPASYMNLFANLALARQILYYALAVECLAWYYRALNELKRECRAAESVWFGGREGARS